jgi:hypothetical protein
VVVVSSSSLGDIINNHKSMGHVAKWGLELMGLNITYGPRMAIKSQVLSDFMAEWTKEQTSPVPTEVEY